MSDYKKYIKYKFKYLNLLKQIGGTWICEHCFSQNNNESNECKKCTQEHKTHPVLNLPEDGKNLNMKTFYIYTTGIGDSNNIENLAKSWDLLLRENVLRNIDNSFNNIIVKHYDPMYCLRDGKETKCTDEEVENFKNELNPILTNDKKHSRISDSNFFHDTIDYEKMSSPYIILDFAHVFRYSTTTPGKVITKEKKIYTNIKSVYIGYVGDLETISNILEFQYRKFEIVYSDFFKVDREGKVTTYFDRLRKLGYLTLFGDDYILYPNDVITDIYIKIRNNVFIYCRQNFNNFVNMFDDNFVEMSTNLVKNIINNIMTNDIDEEELIKYYSSLLIEKYDKKFPHLRKM